VERQAGAPAVFQLASRTGGAPLDPAAPVGATQAAPFHHDRDLPDASLGDAAIQTRPAVRANAPLDLVTNFRVLLHRTNLGPAGDSCQTNPDLD
jgi:hypothetical protein